MINIKNIQLNLATLKEALYLLNNFLINDYLFKNLNDFLI